MASCRVWQPFAVSWVCVPGPARSTHGGDRTAGNCGRGEEIRRRVFAAPCNLPAVGEKEGGGYLGRRAFYCLAVK